MKNKNRQGDTEWEELASLLSGEKSDGKGLGEAFIASGNGDVADKWKELGMVKDEKPIDVDRAWSDVVARMEEEGAVIRPMAPASGFTLATLLRIAAAAIILVTLGIAGTSLLAPDILSRKITLASTGDQKNVVAELPDGSHVTLNRNSVLSWHKNFGKKTRRVKLTGEAFFEIAPDASKPFVTDAGKAKVRVLGTSFNVITSNGNQEVEVFVRTGKVLLSSSSGSEELALGPGYVGTMGNSSSASRLNENPNYLAWKTGLLIYNGQKLGVVFNDLKRVYNMNIEADDPSILENTWTSPIDNQTQETIIRLICASFNLSYTRDGDSYRLTRK